MSEPVCRNCLGSGIELGVYGRRPCSFCSDGIIDEVMSMSDEAVRNELLAAGVDPDAEAARWRAMADEVRDAVTAKNETSQSQLTNAASGSRRDVHGMLNLTVGLALAFLAGIHNGEIPSALFWALVVISGFLVMRESWLHGGRMRWSFEPSRRG